MLQIHFELNWIPQTQHTYIETGQGSDNEVTWLYLFSLMDVHVNIHSSQFGLGTLKKKVQAFSVPFITLWLVKAIRNDN